MNKVIWIVVVVVILVCLVVWGNSRPNDSADEPLKIGAIFPLTGPVAVWGEPLQKGITLAQRELADEGINIEVIYEDSRGEPAQGVSAYNKLVDVDKVDIVFTALSRVTVPLIPLADEDKIPLMMTLVSATGITDQSPYAFRFYTYAEQYVSPHFAAIDPVKYDKISILYINDEYGVSVRDAIRTHAQEKNIAVVSEEAFIANTIDFRTHLTRIKDKNPKALMFVGVTPAEISAAINQASDLIPDIDFFEESVLLSLPSIRSLVGDSVEGVFTNAYPSTLGLAGSDFVNLYRNEYGADPVFAATFAYDMTKLVGEATRGRKIMGEALVSKILGLRRFDSANGRVQIQNNGEINTELYAVKIVGEKLVEIK